MACGIAFVSLGIQTFWFQAVCANHIVWDATEVVEFTRKHTANVGEGLNEIRSIIERLVAQRDARRDSFVHVMRKALRTRLGDDIDEVNNVLRDGKIPHSLVKDALEIAQQRGAFTIFAVVDALTRLSQHVRYAGDRRRNNFDIGRLLATPGALAKIQPDDLQTGFRRHINADWGELSNFDRRENDRALKVGRRLFSSYSDRHGHRFWIITEADRSATTILLPEEY